MLSKVRLNFKKNCLIYVSKGVIWASEYSLGPQIWGPGGTQATPGSTPAQPTPPYSKEYFKKTRITTIVTILHLAQVGVTSIISPTLQHYDPPHPASPQPTLPQPSPPHPTKPHPTLPQRIL